MRSNSGINTSREGKARQAIFDLDLSNESRDSDDDDSLDGLNSLNDPGDDEINPNKEATLLLEQDISESGAKSAAVELRRQLQYQLNNNSTTLLQSLNALSQRDPQKAAGSVEQ